jgi:lipid-binding SYLF domain-containing protein
MTMRESLRRSLLVMGAALLALAGPAGADDRTEIESKSALALQTLRQHAREVDKLIERASGVLIFPDVVEMGFGEGGRYGEGALLVEGAAVAYYATAGAPHRVPQTEGRKAELILFMTQQALIDFRNTINWQVGVSEGLTRMRVDERGRLETTRDTAPVLGMTFSDRGVLQDLDLRGTTINRIAR